jgi:hypothetical protein
VIAAALVVFGVIPAVEHLSAFGMRVQVSTPVIGSWTNSGFDPLLVLVARTPNTRPWKTWTGG